MKLELRSHDDAVYIGDKLNINTTYNFEEDEEILWSGLRLITSPPCLKELQIAKQEIFSKGSFQAGEYKRNKSILIKNNVVPTIESRNLSYELQLILRKQNPINRNEDILVRKSQEVKLKVKKETVHLKTPNPISFSLSGLKIEVAKDVFKPGEAIKISFNSDQLKELEVRLLQKANLVCYCETYGKNCRNIQKLPPAIAGDARTTNMEKEFILLKIPEHAEPSHNYIWEPSEKEFWGYKYGDYCEWSLLVIGRKKPEFGKENIEFELPITVAFKTVNTAKRGSDLFSGLTGGAPSLFNGLSSKLQKVFKIENVSSAGQEQSGQFKFTIAIKNISQEVLEGVTVKLTGLQEGLFETAPMLRGFSIWISNDVKEIEYTAKQSVSALIAIIEDNSQKSIRLQAPVN